MRDQMDAEVWGAGHDRFSEDVDALVRRIADVLGRSRKLFGPPALLLTTLGAAGLAFLGFGSPVA